MVIVYACKSVDLCVNVITSNSVVSACELVFSCARVCVGGGGGGWCKCDDVLRYIQALTSHMVGLICDPIFICIGEIFV